MSIAEHNPTMRAPSPWSGSRHQTRHRWQLDLAGDLGAAAAQLRELAAQLRAADAAGWWLTEPMSSGHLLAARASRRRRATQTAPAAPQVTMPRRPAPRWRLRVIDENPIPDDEVFDADAANHTPVLVWTGHGLEQRSGPAVAANVVTDALRQVIATGLPHRVWGLAAARVGPNFDLVADGSALRMHTVHGGRLERTHEALAFQHAADGAATLLEAAASYERLAEAADDMSAAGGRLTGADDGLLQIAYDRPGR